MGITMINNNSAMTMKIEENKKTRFCSFRINKRLYGVDILSIKEITSETSFTPIFHAPEMVRGYLNIRGQIHLVIDMRILLDFPPKELNTDSCVILFRPYVGEAFGILVDKISDVVEVDEKKIEYHNTQDFYQNNPEYNRNIISEAVCKLNNELMEIINPKCLLEIVEKETVA